MKNEFAQRIKSIEDEFLALKTGSKYTSAKPMNYASVDVTASGIYRVEYKNADENILSVVLNALPTQLYETVLARTVDGKYQDVEIYIDPDTVATTIQLTILSTCEVVGFTKIS